METQISKYLSQNLRYLRNKKNWGQKKLADIAGIPRTTLTYMESGEGNPSLVNLAKVASALGVGIEELISRPRNEVQIIPAADVPLELRSGGKVEIHKLLPDKIKGLEIDRINILAGSIMGGHPHLEGTKEYMSVLKGEIIVHLAGETFNVKKGDVFAFPGNQPHSYKNPKNSTSTFLSVVIPIPANI